MYRDAPDEDRSLLLMGYDRKIIAYRRDTGEPAWKYENESAYHYFVDFVIAGERVYAAVGEYLVCLEYTTGKPLASTQFQSTVLRVMLDQGRIYAFGSAHIYCVDLAGRVLWERPHSLYTDSKMPTFGFPGNIISGFRDSG